MAFVGVTMMASSASGPLVGSSATVGGMNISGMGGGGAAAAATSGSGGGMDELLPLVKQLTNPDQREVVLLELSKKRESFPDLAPILWHSPAVVSALLIEIVSIYPLLTPPTLTAHASNRVCNALALLQCVASHSETRQPFLAAQIPLYLYPFLNTQSKSRPFEYLRLTSLGVIGALVKVDDAEVISFLLSTEIIPLCLRIMETGSELSKTVSTFIVQKILLEETGLNYVCATAERFFAVSQVLANMVSLLTVHPSVRLLKHVVRCYLRLADHARAREALKTCLPSSLRDATFATALQNDPVIQKWLQQLLTNISGNGGPVTAPAGAASAASSAVGVGSSNPPSSLLSSTAAGRPQASSTTASNNNPSAVLGLLDMSNAAGKTQ